MALSMRDEPGTQREYETIFILRPDTNQDGITLVNTRVRAVIEQNEPPAPHGGGKGMKGDKEAQGARKRGFARRKVCRFCADKNVPIDYKDPGTLKYFITDRGKVIPRRISGNCAKHQRKVSVA